MTEETTELLYMLGESERIVGITAYTERPPEAKRDKPVVSAFLSGSVSKIKALKPDLVLGFSDVQAEFARTLILEGLPVWISNMRSIEEILSAMIQLGCVVGRQAEVLAWADGRRRALDAAGERAAKRSWRPKVYFEEWDAPMISCIRWVSELIAAAGGENVFEAESFSAGSRGRYVDVARVQAAAPEVILASWCGKAFDEASLRARLGEGVPAVASGRIHALPAEVILQPGPAALGDGLVLLERLLSETVGGH